MTKHLVTALSVLFLLHTPGLASPASHTGTALNDHYLLSEDTNLHYVESGSGQTIVLLHGNDGTLADFTMSIFDQLSGKYRTLAFDRPGHGESKMITSALPATPERQAEVIHSALVQLGIRKPILVAHSWSGGLALCYATKYKDDLAGIVLLGAMAYESNDSKLIYHLAQVPIVGSALRLAFKATGKPWVKKQLAQAFIPDSPPKPYVQKFLSSTFRLPQLKAAAYDEATINKSLKRLSESYSSIVIPVVIVTGDCDTTVSPEANSYRLHNAIAQSQLIVVHNAGHELCFTRPQEVMKAIDTAVELAKARADLSISAGTSH